MPISGCEIPIGLMKIEKYTGLMEACVFQVLTRRRPSKGYLHS